MTRHNYHSLDIPEDTPPEEYHYTQRRAELLRLVLRAGSPYLINQSHIAERYDVDQSTISRDLDHLSDFIEDELGKDITLLMRATFERVTTELYDEGRWKDAWDVAMDWNRWLATRGAVPAEQRHTHVEANVTHHDPDRQTDDYVVLTPDEYADADLDEAIDIPATIEDADAE